LDELSIYEMHVEGLWTGNGLPGTFREAAWLDHLVELGINAVGLLPTAEAESWTWSYGSSHHFATEYAGGGRDQLKQSHDQAGNACYRDGPYTVCSARTIQVAVNGFMDGNRPWAEARCRVAAALTFLTPGVPMFFMGEEVGAKEPYRYDDWLLHREDFAALKPTVLIKPSLTCGLTSSPWGRALRGCALKHRNRSTRHWMPRLPTRTSRS
jgi:glycosidase